MGSPISRFTRRPGGGTIRRGQIRRHSGERFPGYVDPRQAVPTIRNPIPRREWNAYRAKRREQLETAQ